MDAIVKRLSEPSTYAGLAGAALLLGVSSDEWMTYASAAAGLFAFLAIFLGEKGE